MGYRVFFLIPLIASALVASPKKEYKRIQTDAKEFASEQREALMAWLQGIDAETYSQELLSDEDKKVQVDPKEYKSQANQAIKNPQQEPLETRPKIDIDELVNPQIASAISDPLREVGATHEDVIETPEEQSLQICHEGGAYQISVTQNREVNVVPAMISTRKECLGHKETKTYKDQGAAVAASKSRYKELNKDPSIKTKSISQNKKTLTVKYTHHDNTKGCNNVKKHKTIEEPSTHTSSWVSDNSALLQSLEENPRCRILYSTTLQGPSTKKIKGEKISYDSWKRQVFFNCEGSISDKCQRLRDHGAVLVSKKCIKETEYGECELWEKTYDLGKKAAQSLTTVTFEENDLYGLSEIETPEYEKNTDLSQAAAILSTFSDMETELQSSGESVDESKAKVFRGTAQKCSRSFLNNVLYDCCQKLSGFAVKSKLAACSEKEQCLSQNRFSGKCHFVGTKSTKLGTETEQVYCCFPTKLARLVHEQGRQQLGLSWGSADKPACRGFILKELQKIDFSSLDLSEITEDLGIDKDKLLEKLKKSASGVENAAEELIEN